MLNDYSFSMVAGDFVELYSSDGHASAWNAVVTCFFIDTAPVIMDYFRVIHGLLPTGNDDDYTSSFFQSDYK